MALKIGMRSVDITPPGPVNLQGQFRLRVTTEVETPVMANVFAAESDGQQIIICACDLVGIHETFIQAVREKIAARTSEINVENVIVSAIHTHTGPDTYPSGFVGGLDPKYAPDGITCIPNVVVPPEMWSGDMSREYITTIVADAICDAWESRDDAYFGAAFGRAVVGHCRRACYDDGTSRLFGTTQTGTFSELEAGNDTGVELLYAFDKNKKPLGALVNVACPAQCVEDMNVISSDYWGKVREWVNREISENFVVVGLCSAAGDQCPIDLVRRYRGKGQYWRRSDSFAMENHWEGAAEIGKRLGREIVERLAEAGANMKNEAVIKNETAIIDLPIRRVTTTEYENHLKNVREKIAEFGTNQITPGQASAIHIHTGAIKRYIQQDELRTFKTEVHVARFDDIAFATNSFELFIDYGNQIRGVSPAAQTFLIQLCNGAFGYLPTEKAEKGSHYSAYVSGGFTGHEGGRLLVNKTVSMLNEMFPDVEKT